MGETMTAARCLTARQEKAARRERAAHDCERQALVAQSRRDWENAYRHKHDVLKLWRGCAHPRCRRVRGCAGEFERGPRCCADMSDIEKDWTIDVFSTMDTAAEDSAGEKRLHRFLQRVALQYRSMRPRPACQSSSRGR